MPSEIYKDFTYFIDEIEYNEDFMIWNPFNFLYLFNYFIKIQLLVMSTNNFHI